MNDGKDYSVTIADTTKTFTATDNKVAAVTVTPVTIPYATLTTIAAVATDVQGVVLDETNFGSSSLAGKTIEFTITPAAGGYTTGAQLYLAKKGDTATAKVTVKSGEYDTTGQEINNITSGDVTITAGDQEVVTVNGFKARVTKDSNVHKYDDAKENNSLAVGDTANVFLKFTNSKDKELTAAEYGKYTVSSSNNNVLLMNETTATTAGISVTGVAAGSAYLIVKDEKSNVVATLPVTVSAKRAVNALSIDRTNFVLSTASTVSTETIKLTVKDQYGDTLAAGTDYTVKAEVLASPSGASTIATANANSDSITFEGSSAKLGTYTYKVTVTDKNDDKITRSQVVTVNVKAPSGVAGYAFEISGVDANNTVDATLNEKFSGNKDVTIKIVKTLGGVKESYATYSAIDVKRGNTDVAITSQSAASTATFAAIATSGSVATAAQAGTYVVNATVDGVKVAPATFIVKNDTAKVTVAQTASELKKSVANGDAATVVKNAFKFKFGTTDLDFAATTPNVTLATADVEFTGACTNAGDNLFVKKVTLQVTFATGYTTAITVDVNKAVKVIAD